LSQKGKIALATSSGCHTRVAITRRHSPVREVDYCQKKLN
jgi:hypothetical protein